MYLSKGLKRGQAGRPRALGPAVLGDSWLLSTSIFSSGFLVQLFAFVQYIFGTLHRPDLVNHSFFAFDVHLQHYFFTLCHSPCPMLNHSSHGAIFAENHMSFCKDRWTKRGGGELGLFQFLKQSKATLTYAILVRLNSPTG